MINKWNRHEGEKTAPVPAEDFEKAENSRVLGWAPVVSPDFAFVGHLVLMRACIGIQSGYDG
ncbi:hypothetical protein [Candidatus Binatus sp.]|uniref:hypothetical protein n=1 Tax=Candidatus Binatus sp. TaxID=2811406 RepID=UPI003C51F51D